MKRKFFVVVLLVVVCLSVMVVEGVSQPVPAPSTTIGTRPTFPMQSIAAPPSPVTSPEPQPNFSVVKPQQQEWSFDQLVEALKGVRTRQKELQTQEADLLAKLAEKVEEKRQDLSKSESTLQQLRGENGRIHAAKRIEESKMDGEKK